ncbi:MAG: hypothetical protein IKG56_02630 [Clostridia bacterium]|nr:hypothetical protein [Clostridia bacterium]
MKKILWIVLLLIIIGGSIVFLTLKPKAASENNDTNGIEFNKSNNNENNETEQSENSKEYSKIELSDGILYAVDGEQLKSDFVLGDNYFDTTISDMYVNPEDYYDMNIEIEGMYLTDGTYTSVGRYSTSSLCAYCPAGYSFIEYQLDGEIDKELKAEEDWIKVIGKLRKGNDESSFYQDYFYIEALNIEIMNNKGNDTVNN